jgi:hypothetical protein
MKSRYFISASLPVDVTDDRLFARRLHALADLSVGVLHVAAFRSGFGAYDLTTNGIRPEGHLLLLDLDLGVQRQALTWAREVGHPFRGVVVALTADDSQRAP